MTDDMVRAVLSPKRVVSTTIWAEGRSERLEARAAIGGVMRNRLTHPAKYRAVAATYPAICFAPNQFSCWNPGLDTNHAKLLALAGKLINDEDPADPIYDECEWLTEGLIDGRLQDHSLGATFYIETELVVKNKGLLPTHWPRLTLSVKLGALSFYKEVA